MSGRRPIEYVQATNPIVIIDEPQSVDNTEKAKKAIKTLNPLLCLRYSATHINPYNLLYRLDPIKAYDLRLVKQIEVSSIRSENNFNGVYIRIDSIGLSLIHIWEGRKFATNTPNEGRFHTKWLNMMYPRLYLSLIHI